MPRQPGTRNRQGVQAGSRHHEPVNATDALLAALGDLLDVGERLVSAAGGGSLRASASDLADQLADRPAFTAAVTAADRAALANGYLIHKPEAAKVYKRN